MTYDPSTRFYLPLSLARKLVEDYSPDDWRSLSQEDKAAYQEVIESFVRALGRPVMTS
ncbi:MAG: hypothetical protein AAF528_00875 [Cyanobacteria bacterium P01_C01_bin.121]